MIGAYHAFPETTRPDEEPAREGGDQEISPEAAALAYFMRGVHF
jgi:hypothetical protein